MRRVLLVFAALISVAWGGGEMIQLKFSARNVKGGDPFWGDPDPKLKCQYSVGSCCWVDVGETCTIDNNRNPNWPEIFTFYKIEFQRQLIICEVVDDDVLFPDSLGKVTFELREVPASGCLDRYFENGCLSICRA